MTCLIASGVQFSAVGLEAACGGRRVRLLKAMAAMIAAARMAMTRLVRDFKAGSVSIVKECPMIRRSTVNAKKPAWSAEKPARPG